MHITTHIVFAGLGRAAVTRLLSGAFLHQGIQETCCKWSSAPANESPVLPVAAPKSWVKCSFSTEMELTMRLTQGVHGTLTRPVHAALCVAWPKRAECRGAQVFGCGLDAVETRSAGLRRHQLRRHQLEGFTHPEDGVYSRHTTCGRRAPSPQFIMMHRAQAKSCLLGGRPAGGLCYLGIGSWPRNTAGDVLNPVHCWKEQGNGPCAQLWISTASAEHHLAFSSFAQPTETHKYFHTRFSPFVRWGLKICALSHTPLPLSTQRAAETGTLLRS
jgi:hypothetical protein